MAENPQLAVIGGTGLYQFPGLEDVSSVEVDTPFGSPSAPITIGRLDGRRVAFLARHGIGHIYTPGEVNYRANIYALKSLGVRQVIGVSACGSLRDDYAPGHMVIPDQLVDFTRDRSRSFFEGGLVAHIGVAEPFCEELSSLAYQAVLATKATCHYGGSFITIEGPRFSTKAESNLYREWGMSIIGMTTSPEAFLAREAEMCYTNIAHVTDYDVWHVSEEPVSVEMIIQTLNKNTELAQQAIRNVVTLIEPDMECECQAALSKALTTQPGHIPQETRQKLGLLVDKYLSQ